MILNIVKTEKPDVIDNAFAFSESFVGCASELLEINESFSYEIDNLTLALARLEHQSYFNESAKSLLEAGIGEFFTKVADAIRKYWMKFVEWVGSIYRTIKVMLVGRKKWLEKNEAHLLKLDENHLSATTVKIGDFLCKTNFNSVLENFKVSSEEMVKEFRILTKNAYTPKNVAERIAQAIGLKLSGPLVHFVMSKSLHAQFIGIEINVKLSPSVIRNLIASAKDTIEGLDKLDGYKDIAKAYIKAAEGIVSMQNDKSDIKKHLSSLRIVSTTIQSYASAISTLLHTANSQVMRALATAAAIKMPEHENKEPSNYPRLPVF